MFQVFFIFQEFHKVARQYHQETQLKTASQERLMKVVLLCFFYHVEQIK